MSKVSACSSQQAALWILDLHSQGPPLCKPVSCNTSRDMYLYWSSSLIDPEGHIPLPPPTSCSLSQNPIYFLRSTEFHLKLPCLFIYLLVYTFTSFPTEMVAPTRQSRYPLSSPPYLQYLNKVSSIVCAQ